MSPVLKVAPAVFVFLWASGFIGARYAMPHAEPFSFLATRFAIAAVLLALVVPVIGARGLTFRSAVHSVIVGVLVHGVYLGGVFWAIHRGMPAGLSALLVGLHPLITAFLAGPVLGEVVTRRHWLGLVVGFVGVSMVLSPSFGEIGGVTVATLAASAISVLGLSGGSIWQKRFAQKVDLLTGTVFQYVGASLATFVLAALLENQVYTVTGELVFAMVWLVLVLSIGAILLLMFLIREGAMSRVSSLFYLVPATTAVQAWLLFGEELTPVQIIGMAVAGFGVAIALARTVGRKADPKS